MSLIYPRGPGRPRTLTDAERLENFRASRARSKTKVKNITIDADLVEALNDACDRLEKKFGFRPTMSQTLRYLIKHIDKEEMPR
jgi:hypothetical protein